MIDFSQLSDATSQRILTTIVGAYLRNTVEDSTGLREALATEFEVVPTHTSVSAGELARQALAVLAEDSATAAAIEALANENAQSSGRHTYDAGVTIALGVAALFALRTGIDIERDKRGKWSFKMKIKPADESLLKRLVEKLVNYLPG
jgi:hypothetical protein